MSISHLMEIRAFILSVEKIPRNIKLIEVLNLLGIQFEIITGATPDLAFEYSQQKEFHGQYREEMSKEEMAVTYGHRLMFLSALKSSEKYFLFFEDDAVVDVKNFNELLNTVKVIPKGLILLGACGGFARKFKTIGNMQVLKTIGNTALGSHAYLVDKESIPDLLLGTEGCKFLADHFARRKTRQYVVLPYCAKQLTDSFTYVPKISAGFKRSRIRNMLAPLKMDLIDYFHTGICGGRFLRLAVVEKFFAIFLVKLPGCTLD